MKTITTTKGKFLFVEVPDDAYDFEEITNQSEIPYKTAIQYHTKCLVTGYPQGESVTIGFQFEIISTTKDITEEQAESCVQIVFDTPRLYANYLEPIGITYAMVTNAKDSLNTLIQKKLNPNKNYLILKQINP